MNTVKVFGKAEFREHLGEFKDAAIISIECSPECAKYYLEAEKGDSDNEHLLPPSDTVLNVEFDDVRGPGDYYYEGHWMKAMTGGQAYTIVTFIEKNLGKDFVIHCKAGKSRSKAVGRFILDFHGDRYEDGNPNNPIGSSYNVDILTKLKEKYYSRENLYWYENNKLSIIKEAMEDAGKYVHLAWHNDDYPGDYAKVKDSDVHYLLGAVDGIDDYYWVLVRRDLSLLYCSCCCGYGKIYDIREFTSLTQPFDKWMDRVGDDFLKDAHRQVETFLEGARKEFGKEGGILYLISPGN